MVMVMAITTFMMCRKKNMANKNQIGTVSQICYSPLKKTYVLCFMTLTGSLFYVWMAQCILAAVLQVNLSHWVIPGKLVFRHRLRSFHQGQKIFLWSLRIIPNVLNLSHYEIPFMDTRGHILWRGTWEEMHRLILLNCTTCRRENRGSRLIRWQ